jgi:GT2 family glycosyltransferase
MSHDIAGDGTVLAGARQPLVSQDHYLRLLEDCFIWSGSSIAYRRSAVESLGGFDESLAAGDDYDLYLRLSRRFPVYCHESVVTEYRRHGTNATRDPALVLASQLEVLRRQRPSLRDRRERRARRVGIRKTQQEHGLALAEQVARELRGHRWRRALRGAKTLARRDPRSLTRLLASVA